MIIYTLSDAYNAYWAAKNHEEQRSAYFAILLFGGKDGYPGTKPWRAKVARALRRLAIRIEGSDKWGRPLPL